MYCLTCKHDLIDCDCPDIEERLDDMAECPSLSLVIEMTRKAREVKKQIERDQTEQEGDCSLN